MWRHLDRCMGAPALSLGAERCFVLELDVQNKGSASMWRVKWVLRELGGRLIAPLWCSQENLSQGEPVPYSALGSAWWFLTPMVPASVVLGSVT